MNTFLVIAASFGLAGTVVQAACRLVVLRTTERELAELFDAASDLVGEYSWWKAPKAWWLNRGQVRASLSEHELVAYRRVWWDLAGWVVLIISAGYALAAALMT